MTNQAASDEPFDISKAVPPETIPQAVTIKPSAKFVFNPFDNITLDFNTSCTKEDAVAKMLGWLRGPLRLDPDEINIRHCSIEQMPFLPELYYSLEDYLLMLREGALDQVAAAFKEPCASAQIQTETIEMLNQCEDLIIKAGAYISGIDDELIKGTVSALRIDQAKTESTGEVYITLKSLDEWAQQNYKISIFDNTISSHLNISSVLPHVAKQKAEPTPKGGLSRTSAESLYTTFAFMVEAFAKTAPAYRKDDGKLNVDAISKAIENLATEANKGDVLKGQGDQSIKTIIELAMKEKLQKLPSK